MGNGTSAGSNHPQQVSTWLGGLPDAGRHGHVTVRRSGLDKVICVHPSIHKVETRRSGEAGAKRQAATWRHKQACYCTMPCHVSPVCTLPCLRQVATGVIAS
jgi:hypothetical protein